MVSTQKAHSEQISMLMVSIPIQEQNKNNKNILACAHARPRARETPPPSNTPTSTSRNSGGWVRELEKDPDAKAEVLKSEFYRTSTGEIRKDAFVTALLYDEQVFERFRPLFERMKAEGRL